MQQMFASTKPDRPDGVVRRRARPLCDHRIIWLPPVLSGVIHHDVDEHRQQAGKNSCAVTDLIAVDAAVPRRSAMNHLVTKDIESVEHRCEDPRSVAIAKGDCDLPLALGKTLLPVGKTLLAVEVAPEGREDIAVVEQQPDLLRETRPDGVVDPMSLIEFDQRIEIGLEGAAFAAAIGIDVRGVGGIEADPQQDEADIGVIPFSFGATQPADGPVDTQGHGIREILTKSPLFGFENSEIERRSHRRRDICHKQAPANRYGPRLRASSKVNLLWRPGKLLALSTSRGRFELISVPVSFLQHNGQYASA